MKVFKSVQEWLSYQALERQGSLGFVPTMGALHDGHASLIQQSAQENKATLLSIFVNPTQFNDPKDLEKYPRNLDQDLKCAAEAGANFVLVPDAGELYPDNYTYRIEESHESTVLEGPLRPGHFSGMLTVVLKLLNIAQAQRAYFGEKDFQQLVLIQGLAKAFFLPTEIVACQTVREPSGLARSSRNELLSLPERQLAAELNRVLREGIPTQEAVKKLNEKGFSVEYVADRWNRRLVAAKVGSVRLIDNMPLMDEGSL